MKSTVALVRCNTYEEEQVCRAVERGVDLLGGISRFIKPGERIVIKPNVLIGTDPEKCVTTHPSVLKAIGILLKKAGASVYYGDSSAVGRCEGNMKRAGLKQAADELGITLADFDNGKSVNHEEALLNKRFVIANGVLESDGIVSLPKLKAHPLTRFTGAIKNQFGCVPGLQKTQHHVKMPNPYDFAAMLVDLNTLVRSRLYIMDGIINYILSFLWFDFLFDFFRNNIFFKFTGKQYYGVIAVQIRRKEIFSRSRIKLEKELVKCESSAINKNK